ncbi:hypothetical protein SBV1_770018 [Verrucomicrobia bacterium]|nr:hypothetical protein SBV1_770018 [Verrucomicrobiota bacterium]
MRAGWAQQFVLWLDKGQARRNAGAEELPRLHQVRSSVISASSLLSTAEGCLFDFPWPSLSSPPSLP